jgi:hypothetical protein
MVWLYSARSHMGGGIFSLRMVISDYHLPCMVASIGKGGVDRQALNEGFSLGNRQEDLIHCHHCRLECRLETNPTVDRPGTGQHEGGGAGL